MAEYVYARVTRYLYYRCDTKWASEKHPIWVRGRPYRSHGEGYEFVEDEVIYGSKLPKLTDLGDAISVIDTDTYELVDVEDLPAEVCAVLARWELVGKEDDE